MRDSLRSAPRAGISQPPWPIRADPEGVVQDSLKLRKDLRASAAVASGYSCGEDGPARGRLWRRTPAEVCDECPECGCPLVDPHRLPAGCLRLAARAAWERWRDEADEASARASHSETPWCGTALRRCSRRLRIYRILQAERQARWRDRDRHSLIGGLAHPCEIHAHT